MPKVMCDWTSCRFNSNCTADTDEIGECQHEGEVTLVCVEDAETSENLECQQFEWGEEK